MTGLEPKADQVVREAVDAYFVGYQPRVSMGEQLFETKNSRYRLLDGVLVAAPDSSLCGAELVGWLLEEAHPVVEATWKPGARAVLLDRKRGRHIVVTSAAKLHGQQESAAAGSGGIQDGSPGHHPPAVNPAMAQRTGLFHAMPAFAAAPVAPAEERAAPLAAPLAAPAPAAPAAFGPLPFPSLPPRREAIAAPSPAPAAPRAVEERFASPPPPLSLTLPSGAMATALPTAQRRARQRGAALR